MNYIPRVSLESLSNPFETGLGKVAPMRLTPEMETTGPSFKDALANMVSSVNNTVTVPDTMMHDAMTTGSVDVHDVMIANAKAELVVNVTSQVATKVIQAYDKILQIQI